MKILNLTNEIIDNIISEWQLYRLDKTIQELDTFNQRNDVFWQKVFDVKESISGRLKYKNLAILIKKCLALSHGNSDVERGFSLYNNLLTKTRLNMSEATIIGIRQVKDSVERFWNIFAVPLTGRLLNSVNKSYSAYAAEKVTLARAEEEKEKKRKFEEEEKEKKKEQKKLEEEQTKQNKVKVNSLRNELASANKCLAENNEKLQEAVKEMTISVSELYRLQ